MAIRIFVTGGTFDKEHDPISESFIFTETHVSELLQRSRSLLDIKVRTIMLIDSLEITRGDQEIILKACEDANEDKIVITHGTSNMEKTAQFLGERFTSMPASCAKATLFSFWAARFPCINLSRSRNACWEPTRKWP